jgi:hypothetical protein
VSEARRSFSRRLRNRLLSGRSRDQTTRAKFPRSETSKRNFGKGTGVSCRVTFTAPISGKCQRRGGGLCLYKLQNSKSELCRKVLTSIRRLLGWFVSLPQKASCKQMGGPSPLYCVKCSVYGNCSKYFPSSQLINPYGVRGLRRETASKAGL